MTIRQENQQNLSATCNPNSGTKDSFFCPDEHGSAGIAGEYHVNRIAQTLQQRHWEQEGSPYKKKSTPRAQL